jgi:putative restriction endonuclease
VTTEANPTLALYQRKFTQLKTAHNAPHKYCMLLALIDMARGGEFTSNEIVYGPKLLERYAAYFSAASGPNDHPNPYFPFFHLSGKLRDQSESFWRLVALPGREEVVRGLDTARSHRNITENVSHAKVDDALFALLKDPVAQAVLSETLADQLSRGHAELSSMMAHISALGKVSDYERQLRLQANSPAMLVQDATNDIPAPAVRDPAFRRVVVQAYDYRCSATGLRILLPDGAVMVEAAHLVPFSESRNDNPRNGIALTPNMHWALDKNLIAPTPDFKWKVSRQLDDRVPDFQELTRLEGKTLFLPTDKSLWPDREGLEWRVTSLA